MPSVYSNAEAMTGFLGKLGCGEPGDQPYRKFAMLILPLAGALFWLHPHYQDPASSMLLDDFTDMFWDTLFACPAFCPVFVIPRCPAVHAIKKII